MMATSIATNVYDARNGVGGISLAGSNFATGLTRPRPRTTPRIGGRAAEHASGSISYLQPDPAWRERANYPYAGDSPLLFADPLVRRVRNATYPQTQMDATIGYMRMGNDTR